MWPSVGPLQTTLTCNGQWPNSLQRFSPDAPHHVTRSPYSLTSHLRPSGHSFGGAGTTLRRSRDGVTAHIHADGVFQLDPALRPARAERLARLGKCRRLPAAQPLFAAAPGHLRSLDVGRARHDAGTVLGGCRHCVLAGGETAAPAGLTHRVRCLGGRWARLSRTAATVSGSGRRIFSPQSAYLWALCLADCDPLGAARGRLCPCWCAVW